jgi:hypothetical protein
MTRILMPSSNMMTSLKRPDVPDAEKAFESETEKRAVQLIGMDDRMCDGLKGREDENGPQGAFTYFFLENPEASLDGTSTRH